MDNLNDAKCSVKASIFNFLYCVAQTWTINKITREGAETKGAQKQPHSPACFSQGRINSP